MATPFIEYTTINKSSWGKGPWLDEPDKVQWQDDATGLPCLAVRHSSLGHWCGYVGVDDTHLLHGRNWSDVDVYAHGGVNYSEACSSGHEATSVCHIVGDGDPDHVWWFGFDCAHSGDKLPGLEAMTSRLVFDDSAYLTLEYVQAQCAALAQQLSDVSI